MLTNVREVRLALLQLGNMATCLCNLHNCTPALQVDFDKVKDAASRGSLPVAFLTGAQSPQQFLSSIQQQVRSFMLL